MVSYVLNFGNSQNNIDNSIVNNPDFDSLKEQKQAAPLAAKGVAAFTHCHKYVGERLIFYT